MKISFLLQKAEAQSKVLEAFYDMKNLCREKKLHVVHLYELMLMFSCFFPVACTAAEEDMNNNNIELKWREESKLYSRPGDFIEFDCKIGNVEDPASSPFRVQCINGTFKYPRCNPGSKSSPSVIVWLLFLAYLAQKPRGKPLVSMPGDVRTEQQGVGNPVKL